MVRTEYIGRAAIFLYTAKGKKTGATCKIRVVDSSDGSKTVDDASMSEVSTSNAPGLNRYSWSPSSVGSYAVYMFEGSFASPTWLQTLEVVVLGAEAATPSATYSTGAKIATFMGLRSGASRLVFGAGTIPTLTEVNALVEQGQDFIDQYTGHAWRAVTVSNEIHDYQHPRDIGYYARVRDNRAVLLDHRSIRDLDTDSGDKLEVWNGSSWVDYVTTYTEGRGDDFWVDYGRGIVFFGNHYPSREDNSVRATYRYGESSIPSDIERACTLYVAMQLAASGDNLVVSGTEFDINPGEKMDKWEKQMMRILEARREM